MCSNIETLPELYTYRGVEFPPDEDIDFYETFSRQAYGPAKLENSTLFSNYDPVTDELEEGGDLSGVENSEFDERGCVNLLWPYTQYYACNDCAITFNSIAAVPRCPQCGKVADTRVWDQQAPEIAQMKCVSCGEEILYDPCMPNGLGLFCPTCGQTLKNPYMRP